MSIETFNLEYVCTTSLKWYICVNSIENVKRNHNMAVCLNQNRDIYNVPDQKFQLRLYCNLCNMTKTCENVYEVRARLRVIYE